MDFLPSNSQFLSPFCRDTYLFPFIKDVSRHASTRKKYAADICRLCDYFKKDFLLINEEDVSHYSSDMLSRVNSGLVSEGTVAVRLSVFSRFASFISQCDPSYIDPFSSCTLFHTPSVVKNVNLPSIEEVDMILSAARIEPMYYLIISLSFRCALSTSQILSLTKDSLFSEKDRLFLRLPTHNILDPVHILPLPYDVQALFEEYLSHLDRTDELGHLFYSRKKKALPLSERTLQNHIRNIVSNASVLRDYSLQDIKNKGVVLLLQSGALLDDVKKYTSLGERALLRFKSAAADTSFVPSPSDLVNIRIVGDLF